MILQQIYLENYTPNLIRIAWA